MFYISVSKIPNLYESSAIWLENAALTNLWKDTRDNFRVQLNVSFNLT